MIRENRQFTPEEDELIQRLYEQEGIKKWGAIARILTDDHHLPRNAKQCRDRYQQRLDPDMRTHWTRDQEQRLFELHEEFGNKWAAIADSFSGKDDNCIKNHFYSKLRKALRHLNKTISKNFKKQFRPLTIGAIYKIIEALEDRFHENSSITPTEIENCLILKRQLLTYADSPDTAEVDLEGQKVLIGNITQFSRSYKRKTKKSRRNSSSQLLLQNFFKGNPGHKFEFDHESLPEESPNCQHDGQLKNLKQAKKLPRKLAQFKASKMEEDLECVKPSPAASAKKRASRKQNSQETANRNCQHHLLLPDKDYEIFEDDEDDERYQEKSQNFVNVQKILRERQLIEEELFIPKQNKSGNIGSLNSIEPKPSKEDKPYHDFMGLSDDDSKNVIGFPKLPGQYSSQELEDSLFKKFNKFR